MRTRPCVPTGRNKWLALVVRCSRSRPKRWLVGLVAIAEGVFLAGAASSYVGGDQTWVSVAFALLSVAGLGGLAELARSRIVLWETELEVRTLWHRRRYLASQVASVTWEAGSGVTLRLSDGSWAKLPDLGYNSQGLTNTVRAWLKRAKHAEE